VTKCKCGNDYVKYTTMQTCCIDCLAEKTIKTRVISEKTSVLIKNRELIKEKKAVKARLKELKPLKYWADKAQKAFNRWVVQRDKDLPCISCGTISQTIQYCAGHYRTRKAASQLRYNVDNVHKQCNNFCNLKNSGNIPAYRPALIAKIGQERHDALINNQETKRWTKEECQEIEKKYKSLMKVELLNLKF